MESNAKRQKLTEMFIHYRKVSRRRSFLEKARETIRTATTAASASASSGAEPLPGLKSRPSLARRTSFLESKPVRKMAKLARR